MYKHLTREQRYQIDALLKQGISQVSIANCIGVHKSTISREIKRNSLQKLNVPYKYKADYADYFAQKRAFKPWSSKTKNPCIHRRIQFLLKAGWSPEQIAITCRNRGIPMLSTEGIYLWIYKNRHLHPDQDLTSLLRRRHRKRRKRPLLRQPRIIIKNKTSIHHRPCCIDEQWGHFEADTAKCKNGYLLVLTERQSLYNLIYKLPDKSAQSITKTIVSLKNKIPIQSITSDNGTEFAQHQNIKDTMNIDWYFADPNRPDQRGKNENQIGLIRQYLNRQTDLINLTDQHIISIQNKLNNRPRKKHNFISPKKINRLYNVALDN